MTTKIIPVPDTVRKDLTGRVFGMLTVVGYVGQDRQKMSLWLCQCACGASTVVRGPSLLRKTDPTKSCGCLSRAAAKTHGATKTPEYGVWRNMYQRCTNPNNPQYRNYGGRGIRVCARWRESFDNFLADMGARPSPQHSIDRIDTNGNYTPENCRWATPVQQSNNKNDNRLITYQGQTHTLAEWSRLIGMSKKGLSWRLNNGWTVEDALSTKPDYGGGWKSRRHASSKTK